MCSATYLGNLSSTFYLCICVFVFEDWHVFSVYCHLSNLTCNFGLWIGNCIGRSGQSVIYFCRKLCPWNAGRQWLHGGLPDTRQWLHTLQLADCRLLLLQTQPCTFIYLSIYKFSFLFLFINRTGHRRAFLTHSQKTLEMLLEGPRRPLEAFEGHWKPLAVEGPAMPCKTL